MLKTTMYKFSGDVSEIRQYTNNPKAYGAIFLSTDTSNIYIVNEAQEIIEVCKTNNQEQRYINCKNCAAPLTSYECEYCGTKYY